MDEIRHKKLEEQLGEEIAGLIISGGVKDPRVGPFVSVTRVEAARDLSFAKVYISSFDSLVEKSDAAEAPCAGASAPSADAAGSEADSREAEQYARLKEAADGLNHASGYIQAQIGRRLRLRLTPKLNFIADKGIKEGFEMNEKIKGLFQ